ncbi:hypothetical protein HPB51_024782 [Rhipicephalus microplus]|uniref:Uncharacterized protein n=1 Tax=Rhipicephalus microplus TaxID=6941 RepID=A0A9J6D7T3_RHIMP|nr:hypothetical protein HPB51_024782 [Rhipicephalus microplus]
MCRTALWTRTRTPGQPPLPGSVNKNGNPVLQCTRGYSIAEPPQRLANGHLVALKDRQSPPLLDEKALSAFVAVSVVTPRVSATRPNQHNSLLARRETGEVTFESTASGEDVYLVDPVTSTGIVFSREELLKAQQDDPFCQLIVDDLKELSSQAELGGQATGRGQTAGIAVGAECRTQTGSLLRNSLLRNRRNDCPKLTTGGVVSYFKEHELSLLQADKVGGFVVMSTSSFPGQSQFCKYEEFRVYNCESVEGKTSCC